MSFYGSTFFQLIDTFYKMGIVNKGKDKNTFATTTPEDSYMTQATGRKGVIRFGTGNRWIQATKETDEQGDIYTFWHMAPETTGTNLPALEVLTDVPASVDKDNLGELTPGGFVKISSLRYDPAGHIGSTDTTYYKIPISQTEQDIIDLKEAVGVPAADGGEATGLFLAIDEANANIEAVTETADTVRDELGSYSSVFPSTGIYRITGDKDIYKNFYDEFGSLDDFRLTVYEDSSSTKSFIEGILKVKEDTDEKIKDNSTMMVVYGEAIEGQKTQIQTLTDKVAELEARLAALES